MSPKEPTTSPTITTLKATRTAHRVATEVRYPALFPTAKFGRRNRQDRDYSLQTSTVIKLIALLALVVIFAGLLFGICVAFGLR